MPSYDVRLQYAEGMRIVLMMTLATAIASGQFAEFAAPGDGSRLYFSSSLPLQASNERAQGRIFSVDATGVQTVADVLDTTSSVFPYSIFYSLSRPEASRDGSVVIYTVAAECDFGSGCGEVSASYSQTTIIGLAGGVRNVNGTGRISGNGRYLLLTVSLEPVSANVLDLQTGQLQTRDPLIVVGVAGAGRVVADDGTIVVTPYGQTLLIAKGAGTQTVKFAGGPYADQAVIDSSGQNVVYVQYAFPSGPHTIHLYKVTQFTDTTLFSQGDSTSPCVSADGTRAMFVSTASGSPQIWVVNTDGTGASQVSSDQTGVLKAVMSDDGQTAWYLSGSGRIIQLDLSSGDGQERISRTPFWPGGVGPNTEPGSEFFLNGAGFSDATYSAAGYPLPQTLGGATVLIGGAAVPLLSVSPTQIVAQLPWETAISTSADVEIVTASSSPFQPGVKGAMVTVTGFGNFVTNPTTPATYSNSGYDALAIHQDWSAPVTPSNPARPNEILHLYGLSFGPVTSHPPTGMPVLANSLSSTVNPITCWAWAADNANKLNVPALFSGLAPGTVGVYQLDIQMPPSNLRVDTQVQCNGSGNDSEFFGAFTVQQ
jgi:uncharacterized protein (TIGR03437 family)